MKTILDDLNIDYKVGIGEAAFYGPKLDIQIKNVFGKEDTLVTIQIDQMLAEKFGMEYVDKDGIKKNPYIIHRTSIGCYERTLALLIEKYAGAFPTWLAPVQVKLLPIADRHLDYLLEAKKHLKQRVFAVKLMTEAKKSDLKFVLPSLKKCLICSLQAIRILKIILYRFVPVQAGIRVLWLLMNLLKRLLLKLSLNHLNLLCNFYANN